MRRTTVLAAMLAVGLTGAACNTQGDGGDADGGLNGSIRIDGSSTVYPISSAMAEQFQGENPDVETAVGLSGTGGGFEKFCAGETQISDASRPIEADEKAACEKEGITYTELKVAIDGLSVAVNKNNAFASCLTTAELKKIWMPDSAVRTWKDVRPAFPDEEIKLYGPGADSGTFDYFTDAINGEEGASRDDYTASENDNQLVRGVAGDQYALGYFGFAYLAENTDKLKGLGVDAGEGCVEPSQETIESGNYAPLSRPLFIYVNDEALGEEHVATFVRYYLDNVSDVAPQVGYVAATAADIDASKQALEEAAG